jgi:hypothetical protein
MGDGTAPAATLVACTLYDRYDDFAIEANLYDISTSVDYERAFWGTGAFWALYRAGAGVLGGCYTSLGRFVGLFGKLMST